MIRFSCDTCKRSLRAPMPLAGKKGRCARCGAVNRIPPAENIDACDFGRTAVEESSAQSVDVRRTTPSSPFRSTADVPVHSTIEGTVQLEHAHFSSTEPATTIIDETPANSLAGVPLCGAAVLAAVKSKAGGTPAPQSSATSSLAVVVPQTVDQTDRAAIIHSADARPAPTPIPASVVRIGDARDVLQNLAAEYHEPFARTFEPRSVNLAQAVRAALVVGAVLGFCVGLIASKWLL
jgi:hypothetical protein